MPEVMSLRQSRGNPLRMGSFVIRIRQEEREEWIGRIEHVQTGGRRCFRNLMELMEFIESHLERPEEDERR